VTGAADIPVGDPTAPLGRGHVEAHQQLVDYIVDLTEKVADLTERMQALEEFHEPDDPHS
jgi:hypothetical protein